MKEIWQSAKTFCALTPENISFTASVQLLLLVRRSHSCSPRDWRKEVNLRRLRQVLTAVPA